MLHYITLCYITLHCDTLHYTALKYITLCYNTLHCDTHCATLHYTALKYITLRYNTLHCITLHYITLHCVTLHYIVIQYITLCYIIHYVLYCVTLCYTVPHCLLSDILSPHLLGVLIDHHLLVNLVDPTQEIQQFTKSTHCRTPQMDPPPTTDNPILAHTLTQLERLTWYSPSLLHSPFLPSSLLFPVHLGHHRFPVLHHFQ